jgi:hypothetical protein
VIIRGTIPTPAPEGWRRGANRTVCVHCVWWLVTRMSGCQSLSARSVCRGRINYKGAPFMKYFPENVCEVDILNNYDHCSGLL